MTSSVSKSPPPISGNTALVIGSVIGLHAVALWALNSGLIQRTLDIKEPEPIVATLIAPPPPDIKPPEAQPLAPPPPPEVKPKPRPAPPKPRVAAPKPAPQPLAVKDAHESAMAVPAPSPPAPATPPAPPAPPPAPPSPPAPPAPPAEPKIVLPSTSASHLNNPRPEYPMTSKRMGEEGKVMLRVLVSADGRAEQVDVLHSSGFDRLDESAARAVRKWRFKPGTKNGEPQSMWFKQPINFSLNQ